MPKVAQGVLSVEELKEAYAADEILQAAEEELTMVATEHRDMGPMLLEMKNNLARLGRNRRMLMHRSYNLQRTVRARKKLIIQRKFDQHLSAIRKQLGLGRPRRIILDNLSQPPKY